MNVLVAHNCYKLSGGEDQRVAAEIPMLRAHGHQVTQYCLSNHAIDGMGHLELARRTIWSRPAFLNPAQFNNTITEFCWLAARAKKPVLLEEFGYARSNQNSDEAYDMWLDTLTRHRNCAGWMVWRLVSWQDSGRYPVDEVEQFDVHNDGGAL